MWPPLCYETANAVPLRDILATPRTHGGIPQKYISARTGLDGTTTLHIVGTGTYYDCPLEGRLMRHNNNNKNNHVACPAAQLAYAVHVFSHSGLPWNSKRIKEFFKKRCPLISIFSLLTEFTANTYLLGRLKMSHVLAFPRTTLCARSRLQRFEQQKCYGIAEMTRDALIQRDASC